MQLRFRQWLMAIDPDFRLGYTSLPEATVSRGDVGLQAFVASQNRSLKDFLKTLLQAKKITDPRLVQEAETLIADHSNSIFNYGEELLRIASAGRGRLAGADTLQGATEAAGKMWELLWRPESYGTQTWESRFPLSVQRGGILGTVRAFANNLIGHFAQRLRKSRASVSTFQQSQTEDPIDPEARASYREGDWEEWKAAIIRELVKDLHDEMANGQGGKHRESRIRNLRWAIAIADKQMAFPYQWRSMPEVMAEIPGLQGIQRGGLQQTLKTLIDNARLRAVAKIGTEKEQAVAYGLQRRGHRSLERTEGSFLPFATGKPLFGATRTFGPCRNGDDGLCFEWLRPRLPCYVAVTKYGLLRRRDRPPAASGSVRGSMKHLPLLDPAPRRPQVLRHPINPDHLGRPVVQGRQQHRPGAAEGIE
jgi:hypothetical protein